MRENTLLLRTSAPRKKTRICIIRRFFSKKPILLSDDESAWSHDTIFRDLSAIKKRDLKLPATPTMDYDEKTNECIFFDRLGSYAGCRLASIRQIQAFQHVRDSKGTEAMPAGWEPGQITLKPGPDLADVWKVWNPKMEK